MTYWLVEKAGVQISIQTDQSATTNLIKHALDGLNISQTDKRVGILLEVSEQKDKWQLTDHADNQLRKASKVGDLIYYLFDRIVYHIANNTSKGHCLHAACVGFEGKAVMIPANSGAGKSSFTSWMVQQGFDYVTDELVILGNDGHIDGVVRPIQIKSHGIEVIKPLLLQPDMVYQGDLVSGLPAESLGGRRHDCSNLQLSLLIFPHYSSGGGYQFRKLSSADAGMLLMANHINARNLQGHGFREMMQVIRATQCYELNYGGFELLPDDFAEQVQQLVSG